MGWILAAKFTIQPRITKKPLSPVRRQVATELQDLDPILPPLREDEPFLPRLVTISRHRSGNPGCDRARKRTLHEAARMLIHLGDGGHDPRAHGSDGLLDVPF